MQIKDPGHIYILDEVITNQKDESKILVGMEKANIIRFVNNEGPSFYNGTQTQEILRVLIDRTMHCDNCLRWPNNDLIIYHLRMALVLHEARALERKVEKGLIEPEHIILSVDGHYDLDYSQDIHRSNDAIMYRDKEK